MQKKRHRKDCLHTRDDRCRYRDGFLKFLRLRQVFKFAKIRDMDGLNAWLSENGNFKGDAEFVILGHQGASALGELLVKYHVMNVHMEDDHFMDTFLQWSDKLWYALEARIANEAGDRDDDAQQSVLEFNFFAQLYLHAHFGSLIYRERILEHVSSGGIPIIWEECQRRLM